MSKVKISKAIHNLVCGRILLTGAVVNMSKVKISKAIHNPYRDIPEPRPAVVNMSKVKISKAIHNLVDACGNQLQLLSICQR